MNRDQQPIDSDPDKRVGSLASSFRDPAGFMLRDGDVYKRVVTDFGRDEYDLLMQSGLYDSLVREGLLIPHAEDPNTDHLPANGYKVIVPEQIPPHLVSVRVVLRRAERRCLAHFEDPAEGH